MNLKRALSEPRLLPHRIWRRLYQLQHPDHPWLAPGAIRLFDELLTKNMRGLEFGSGRSTAWFAKRLGELTSVEHDASWHARVQKQLSDAGLANVEYLLVKVPYAEQARSDAHWQNSPYVQTLQRFEDDSLDFVLVDGLFRQECTARALPKIKPGGILAIDQASWLPKLEDWLVPSDWDVVYHHPNPLRDTVVWQKPLTHERTS